QAGECDVPAARCGVPGGGLLRTVARNYPLLRELPVSAWGHAEFDRAGFQTSRQLALAVAPQDLQGDLAAGASLMNGLAQVLRSDNVLVFHAGNDVARAESRLLGRRARDHLGHK